MDCTLSACWVRLRKELAWKALGLEESNPSKFATSSWTKTQYPFLAYRFISFAYASSIISWNIYLAAKLPTSHEVAVWFLSFPTWSFFLFTIYQILGLLLVILNFNDDCLCNDDLSWYHKVCWVLHVVTFNTATSCFLGRLLHAMAESNNDSTTTIYTGVFVSDNINFDIICSILMMVDVFLHNITVRLLHFVYPSIYFLMFFLFHVYRWAAGFQATQTLFDFNNISGASPALLTIIVMVIYVPLVHTLAYGIDFARRRLLVAMWERNRQMTLQTANSSFPATTNTENTGRAATLTTTLSEDYTNQSFDDFIYALQRNFQVSRDTYTGSFEYIEEDRDEIA